MPPEGPRLTEAEVGLLKAWVEAGANWPPGAAVVARTPARSSHWSFQPVRTVPSPIVKNTAWVRQPIDNFVLVRLEAEGIEPSREAGQEKLYRRLSLDLTGLPPSDVELASYLKDDHRNVVERLLASPRFGEKWARHWLDLARYSDSDGYQKDEFRPNAFRYRDWVIDAYNRDLPYDRFTIEQIAGDLLPGSTLEQKTATGFHRMTLTSREAGIDLKQLRTEQVEDRANTTAAVWMGLTVGCAACHDHKFDPISQKEHYQLYAYFDRAQEASLNAPLAHERRRYDAEFAEYARQRDTLLESYGILRLQPEFERLMKEAAKPGAPAEWVANRGAEKLGTSLAPRRIRLFRDILRNRPPAWPELQSATVADRWALRSSQGRTLLKRLA
jgi:hypothetical protein